MPRRGRGPELQHRRHRCRRPGAPGNGTNKTQYGYDYSHQLTTLTPVTGSSLASRTFTYDTWGRPATATNGRGTTLSYSYDAVGRLSGTRCSMISSREPLRGRPSVSSSKHSPAVGNAGWPPSP